MTQTQAEQVLDQRAQLFKALGHPTRLLMLNLMRARPRHGEELAAILNLNPATISHHLAKLAGVGLVETEREQYYQVYSLRREALRPSLDELIQVSSAGLVEAVETDAYRTKVLGTFFRRGRLRQIPAQRKKRRIILERLVEEFEPDRSYDELAVNRILLEFHEDVATLRRELIMEKLMERDHGVYRRVTA